uniref:Putative reverse transcriptase, RNA-dependent DNA polymerase, Gag-polypeptide of LTR copia-type n=1 Tax=Tanacetum cinerariifolium TaxID=118510 RepID=A0A6L2NSR4_TANCI|nr:putative reverse transcriptase, RNA-dependent DNA polymerase, Gag-polypeptide of LTR copia-type [Tanacetum cinerariifolium]
MVHFSHCCPKTPALPVEYKSFEFFNTNTLDDLLDIPNDEERRNPTPKKHVTLPPYSGSPSTPLNEDDGSHFQGADASASEGESHDKFGSRSEKYVLVGYSNFKKVYKLWSLDNKHIIYSRDVKFFEDIFPFKQNVSFTIDNSVQNINHLNFFNTNTLDDLLDIPNDEERRNPTPKKHVTLPPYSGSPSTPLNEDDGSHFQGADASANEGERSIDLD